MSKSRSSSIAFALVTCALNRNFGVTGAAEYTPYSKSTVALVLREDELWDEESVKSRANHAPEGCYLAFDFVINLHSGKEMEGLDYNYSSSHNSTKLSHKFSNMTLVKPGHQPTPIQIKYAPSKNLSTREYAYLSPVESLKASVSDAMRLGIKFVGVIADGEFSSQEAIRFHKDKNLCFLGRIKSNRRVDFEGQMMSLGDLAGVLTYKHCHYDSKTGWRSKKLAVRLGEDDVFVLIVYRKDKGVWKPFFLVSTFPETYTLAELLRIWKSRWGIEVVHRFIKQNLGFSKSQAITIVAQQNWANAVLDAFIAILVVKRKRRIENWRAAQEISGRCYAECAVTDISLESWLERAV